MKGVQFWVKIVAVVYLCSGGWALAEPLPRVVHGQEITQEFVGPAFLGRASGRIVTGSVIADRKRPDFAVLVPQATTYDGFEVAGPHLLIEDVTIEGALDISVSMPVILRRVIVLAPTELPWLVLVRPGAGALYVLWSDIGGAMIKRSAAPHVGVAVALRGDGARIYRSRIGSAADGVQIAGRNTQIVESLIGNLLARPGDHNDAIQLFDPAVDIEIVRCRIENRHSQTSALTILGRNVIARSNLMAGGGWTLYGGADRNGKGGGSATGVRIEDNIFSRAHFPHVGSFGAVTYWPSGQSNVWRANRDDRGRAVTP